MKTIIAGSRTINKRAELMKAIESCPFHITSVVSGHANGADQLGEWYSDYAHIPLEIFPADWSTHGKSAGYKRNVDMANNAQALLVLWDGQSSGTRHMINIAKVKKLQIHIHLVSN